MKEGKKSFILYLDNLKISEKLSDKKLGKFFRAIIKYHNNENYELPKQLELVFEIFKSQFKRDEEKYHQICIRNRINGEKGGRPRTNPVGLSISQKKPTEPNKPKKADNDNDNVNDNVNDNDNEREKKKKFYLAPSFENEVYNYFLEKLDDEKKEMIAKDETKKFINYYGATDWVIRGDKIINWKNSASGWFDKIDQFKKHTKPVKKEKQTGAQEFKEFVSNSITHE